MRRFNEPLPELKSFVLPGGTRTARRGCTLPGRSAGAPSGRRSRRRGSTTSTRSSAVYLNRLSDLLFILARAANALAGADEPLWKPGASAVAGSAGEVFRAALRLGLTSFGGPVAHIGYFREEYVARRRWIGEEQFGELVALSNLLPGPSSSQVGIAIGVHRAGKLGGLAAWLGFTLPFGGLILTALALWARGVDLADAGWVHGLELGGGRGRRDRSDREWRERSPAGRCGWRSRSPPRRSRCSSRERAARSPRSSARAPSA